MTQNNEIKEFELKEKYPVNKNGIRACLVMMIFCVPLIIMSVISYSSMVEEIFFKMLMSGAGLLSFLVIVMMFQHTFSLDERFLTSKDKMDFIKFYESFPQVFRKDFMGHLDLERVSLKDIKILNKKIRKFNK